MKSESARIATLNDQYRSSAEFYFTVGARRLVDLPGLIHAVREHSEFTEDNDPYGEHDFGVLEWHDETVYWKIDYYAEADEVWEYPLSPRCRRVLTVLLASEY